MCGLCRDADREATRQRLADAAERLELAVFRIREMLRGDIQPHTDKAKLMHEDARLGVQMLSNV